MSKRSLQKAIVANVIEALKNERLRRDLSMTVVAADAGIDTSYLSRVERGLRNPTLDVFLLISGALEIDLWPILKEATEKAKREQK